MSGQHAIVHRLIPGGADVNLADEVTWDLLLINTHSHSGGASYIRDLEETRVEISLPCT